MSKWCWHRWSKWTLGQATTRNGFTASTQDRQCEKCGKYQTKVLTNVGWR